VNHALAAAATLAKEGVSVEVIDLRTISPWDKEPCSPRSPRRPRRDRA